MAETVKTARPDLDAWVLVPREPTEAMLSAFETAYWQKSHDAASPTPTEHPEDGGGPFGYGYRAMIAAAPTLDPASIAASLEVAADRAGKDAVWCSSDERAIAQVSCASTCRRLAAVLRRLGFGEARHG